MEQLATWSYLLGNADADQASFNMLTAILCRNHQGGRLDSISTEAGKQVAKGIRIYKEVLRQHIQEAVPLYPLGMSDVTNPNAPVALGMRSHANSAGSLATQRSGNHDNTVDECGP